MSSEYPLVSVVITTVGSDYVLKAVNSAKSQTYQNIEIIVCYDGAQFDSFEEKITSEFNGIKILNVGPFNNANNARQTGIEQANGEFIALLDDDDYWSELHIQLNVQEALNYKHRDIVLVSNSVIIENGKETKVLPERYFEPEKESVVEYLFFQKNNKKTLMQTSSFFFNKEVGLRCPFDRTLTLHQDYDWIIRVDEMKDILIKQTKLNTSFYVLDINQNSISKKSKAINSIFWAEKMLKNYSPKIKFLFYRRNTLWFLRNENLIERILLTKLASKKLNIGKIYEIYLIGLCIYGYLKMKIKSGY